MQQVEQKLLSYSLKLALLRQTDRSSLMFTSMAIKTTLPTHQKVINIAQNYDANEYHNRTSPTIASSSIPITTRRVPESLGKMDGMATGIAGIIDSPTSALKHHCADLQTVRKHSLLKNEKVIFNSFIFLYF